VYDDRFLFPCGVNILGIGSEGYAREELRGEIASLIVGSELEIGYDPERHAGMLIIGFRSLLTRRTKSGTQRP
jgi:hypothetical protein